MQNNRTISYGQALHEALTQEMEQDKSVFVMGQGVDDAIGQYGTTLDLHKKFGADRNFDTPIAEDAMTGVAIGAALAGMRPVHVHQRMDFLMLCMNQLINMAAKYHYVSDGQMTVPMVVRTSIGRSWGQGPQHSQAPYAAFMHVPGIKILAPTTPHDAKGGLIAAIRDNNPVIFIEHRLLFANKGVVPTDPYEIEIGKARVLREGTDITLIGMSYTVTDCLRAATLLAEVGISAEVIDLLSLAPLDMDTITKSVKKTGRLITVDNSWASCGAGAEIISRLFEAQSQNSFQAARMGFAPTTCPTTRNLEDVFYPSPTSVAEKAATLCGIEASTLPTAGEQKELEEFRGPF
ncbi:MAG: alpha-ketoacid dehydrogenase subunit beta [Kordiimonadaceae bacterium]|nr:alpha-ketoacid dehydrogenase subunit beta [Kordiimonadaceae bacterium]